ncbi:DNA polymerase III polC-type [Gracilibacillus boraciitolerans JCM 21714]|uniref:DNA polymerase III polC-type n=1 Tax=Gracilibacillus boraciitolerans JCM 21714 TaxID=1298598 RepID=W4VP81_9BACI|nr:exonuclease domain-containing protein [Gracilibacillus boraciitolerans]GAE94966.1 DNA polymerase III polC-type [Gracilibacillus boraciitolerans JCM 21714]
MGMNQMLHFIKQMSGKMSDINPVSSQTDARKIAYIRNLQRELKQKDVLNTPFKDLDTVVFDIETTGFYPYSGDRILSIGAVKMKGSEILEDQLFYKTIFSELPPPPEIETLTGITATELQQAADLPEVLRQFFHFVRSDTLVAHHSSHEKQFMKQASWTALKTNFQHRIIDTTFLTKIVSPESKHITLDDWCDHYGVDIGRRHHALYDAAATAKLWSENMKRVEEMGFINLKDVYTHIASLT